MLKEGDFLKKAKTEAALNREMYQEIIMEVMKTTIYDRLAKRHPVIKKYIFDKFNAGNSQVDLYIFHGSGSLEIEIRDNLNRIDFNLDKAIHHYLHEDIMLFGLVRKRTRYPNVDINKLKESVQKFETRTGSVFPKIIERNGVIVENILKYYSDKGYDVGANINGNLRIRFYL